MASGKTTDRTPHKQSYQRPTLTQYGQLKDLTTGGSGNSKESASGKKPRP